MTVSTPVDSSRLTASEAVRRALEDLSIAGERGKPDGVSASAMARACGIKPQSVAKIIKGSRTLSIDNLALLPSRAFDTCIAAIRSARATVKPDTTRHSLTDWLVSAGHTLAAIGEILADGRVDPGERIRARLELAQLRAQIDATIAQLDREDPQETLRAVR
jgi:hypothetical protein